MDFGSPIAALISLGAIVFGIILLDGQVSDFIDPASIMLTVIPTFGALFIAFPVGQMLLCTKHIGIIMGRQKYDPLHYVRTMTDMAEKARKQGILALEYEVENLGEKFVKDAIMMVVDAMDPETVEKRLYGSIDAITARHQKAWAIYEKGAAFAPSFGMVATLISLVNMLMNLSFEDAGGVASLGINMSAAMITTFYGCLLANILFTPIGNKLRMRHQKEIECKKLVLEGILAIQQGINPKIIREILSEQLEPKLAEKLNAE
jgi:chemotaxis protein MotA